MNEFVGSWCAGMQSLLVFVESDLELGSGASYSTTAQPRRQNERCERQEVAGTEPRGKYASVRAEAAEKRI